MRRVDGAPERLTSGGAKASHRLPTSPIDEREKDDGNHDRCQRADAVGRLEFGHLEVHSIAGEEA